MGNILIFQSIHLIKIIKRKIKLFFLFIVFIYYMIKLYIYFLLFGYSGISHVIEYLPNVLYLKILKYMGVKIGRNVTIDSGLVLHGIKNKKNFGNLSIGNNVHIGHHMLFDLFDEISIKDNTAFGANCQIWTHTGNWTKDKSDEKNTIGQVKIGTAVICYSGVIISQGISIGDYARIGAGSVVLRNIEKLSFYAGNPAKFIKSMK